MMAGFDFGSALKGGAAGASTGNPVAAAGSALLSGFTGGGGGGLGSTPSGVTTGPAQSGDITVGGLNVPAYPFAYGGPGGVPVEPPENFTDRVLSGVAVAAVVGLLILAARKAGA